MTLTIYEVMQILNKSDNPQETLALLETDSIFIKYLKLAFGVEYTFSPDLGVGFPQSVRLDRRAPEFISDTTLRSEHRGLYLFEDDKDLSPKKRLQLFAGVLEGLHYKEADLMIAMKDGKFTDMFPNITYSLVNSVFPQWFPETIHETIINAIKADTSINESIEKAMISELEAVPNKVDMVVADTEIKPVVEPVKLDKRSKAYRESIGRK